MINNIDFSNFKSYQGKESKSFELLCYHICIQQFGHLGEFTAIDGSGGDGGIEFYLELQNGDIWGWQCKYFGGSGRLNESNRKNQIKNSLKTAVLKKQNLKRWILCLKNDLTQLEIDWLKKESKSYSSILKTSWWGDSYLTSFLSKEKFNGISKFFFGQLELSNEWFTKRFTENFESVKEKYDEDVHIKDEFAYAKIQKSLLSEEFFLEIDSINFKLSDELAIIKKIVNDIRGSNYLSSDDLIIIDGIIEKTNNSVNIFSIKSDEIIKCWINKIKSKKYDDANKFDFDKLFNELNDLEIGTKVHKDNLSYNLQDIPNKIDEQIKKIFDILEFFRSNNWNPIVQDIHIFGNAGDGKTHLSCDIAKNQLDKKLPVIFIPAIKLSQHNNVEKAILTILDIPLQYSFEDFLETLNTVADVKNCRIPIFIEGLNETRNQSYGFSDLWEIHLKSFIKKIKYAKNIVLITTCRKSYKERIWADEVCSPNFINLSGFVVPLEAMKKYFKKYKIQTTIKPVSIFHFQKPIFLQIFCLAYGSNSNEVVKLELSENIIFDTYEQYFKKVNENVIKRYSLPPVPKIVIESLNKIGINLWTSNKRAISLKDYYRLLNDKHTGDFNISPAKILLNEDLLFITEYQNEIEVVEFSYQFLAGFTIARSIVEQYKNNVLTFVNENNSDEKLFSTDYEKLHPLFDDIRESLSILLITKLDIDLCNIFKNDVSKNISVSAIFKISNEKITDDRIKIIIEKFENKEIRNDIFKLALFTFFSPNSKLNMTFWTKILESITLVERDLSWTEFVRSESNIIEQLIDVFEKSLQLFENGEVKYSEKEHNLIAEFLMWVLTSTNLYLRDITTKALYKYSLIYSENFIILVIKSIQINDYYIQERMLGVLYGLSLGNRFNQFGNNFYSILMPNLAKEIYQLMFDDNSIHSTTHAIIRDYASRILQLAQMNCMVFKEFECENFKKPFSKGGIREWEESEPRETNKWRGPIHMDFDNYQIGYIVPDGHSYSNPPEKQQVRKQIYWRIYNLGYKEEIFEKIDNHINSWQHSRGDRPKVERYGKKYSWIAYYEIAGLREDLGQLKNNDFDDVNHIEPRKFIDSLDISFPNEIRKFQLFNNDQLGRSISVWEDWINNGGVAPIEYKKHLVVSNLANLEGEWVCLDGFVNETDNTILRSRFTFIRGFFIENDEYEGVFDRLKNQDMGGRWLPDPNGDYDLYLGEVGIWDEGYSNNNWRELNFKIGTEKEKVDEDDLSFQWLENIFKENKTAIKPKSKRKKFMEREKSIYDKRKVLLPVIEHKFSTSDTSIKTPNGYLPNVEIQRFFDLVLKPQTFDFYDTNNKIVSITFEHNLGIENYTQRFTFLRKDMFDEFLEANNLSFAWVQWGERDIGNQMYSQNCQNFKEENSFEPRKVFSEVIKYVK